MGKHFFDFEDGDFAHSISDNMAIDMKKGSIENVRVIRRLPLERGAVGFAD